MDVTIIVTDDLIEVAYGQESGSRHMWRGAGVNVYVKGSVDDADYERVQHMAMVVADEAHIPVSSLRRVNRPVNTRSKSIQTDTKRMF